MASMKIKKGDLVKVIAGKDKNSPCRRYQHDYKTYKTKYG